MTIGSAYTLGDNELEMEVRGRDQVAGLPVTKRINSVEIRECLSEPILQIVESVKLTLEKVSSRACCRPCGQGYGFSRWWCSYQRFR